MSYIDPSILLRLLEKIFAPVVLCYADKKDVSNHRFHGWTRARWPMSGYESDLVDLLDKAERVQSCTNGLDSYLLPSTMNESHWKNKLRQGRLSDDLKKRMWDAHMKFTKETLDARNARSFSHRLLVSRDFLEKLNDNDRSGILHNFRAYHGVVEPFIPEPDAWDSVSSMIKDELCVSSWHKLLVIDEKIAVLWYQQEDWWLTQDPEEVRQVKKVLEAAFKRFPAEKFNKREGKRIRSLFG